MKAIILISMVVLTLSAKTYGCPEFLTRNVAGLSEALEAVRICAHKFPNVFYDSYSDMPDTLFGKKKNTKVAVKLPEWGSALKRYEEERDWENLKCEGSSPCPLPEWKKFLGTLEGLDPMVQLEKVNSYVNKTSMVYDKASDPSFDHWATPQEFLGKAGDCEEYAIAKYFSLRKLGWNPENLHLVFVTLKSYNNDSHMVLVADIDSKRYVLDNFEYKTVVAEKSVQDFEPSYAVNEESGAWYNKK